MTTDNQIQGFAPHASGSSWILILSAAVRLSGVFNINPGKNMTSTIDKFLTPYKMSQLKNRSRYQIKKTKKQLLNFIEESPNSLRAFVAEEALNAWSDDPAQMFEYLQQCGCQSGLVCSLIWYRDTRAFYDRYYDEIEELREEYEDSFGQPLQINGDLKNWFAWFAFEETAYQMANELGLDI